MNKLKKQGGFTLVELIIVIAILAILTVAAIPIYNGVRENAEKTAARSDASVLVNALNNYNAMRQSSKPALTATTAVSPLYLSASEQLVLTYGDSSEVIIVQIGSAEFTRALGNINCDSGYWQLNDDIE